MAVDVFEQPRSCSGAARLCVLLGALTAGWLLLSVVGSHHAEAAPASPHVGTMRQPDGDAFRSRVFGDEWYHGRETADGYTVVRDEAGFWHYAARTEAGRLRPSGRVVGRDAPGRLRKHLRDDVEAQRGAQLADDTELADPVSEEPATVAQSTSLVTPTTTHRSLVILASFNDQRPVGTTAEQWSDRFFGPAGSVKDYYEEVSYGAFTVLPAAESSGTANDGIIDWVSLNMSHPGDTDFDNARRMVKAAVLAADASVDFGAYDANNDGVVVASELHVTVIAAGYEGAYHTVPGKAVWGHRWSLYGAVTPPVVDGKTITGGAPGGAAGYTTFGEMHNDHQATVGIITHELGHDIGWPDLYDTDASPEVSQGVGNWSVMGGGSWLYLGGQWPGATPAHPDAWSKWLQGWITPTAITSSTLSAPVNAAASATKDNVALQVRDNPGGATDWRMHYDTGAGEYFLIENRQRTSGTYDAALPGVGLLVWHINEASADNDVNDDRLVDLEEADGRADLDAGANRGDAGDPYPGSAGNRSFSSTSSPSSRLNVSDDYSGVTIESISDSGTVMTANVTIPTANDAFAGATEITSQSHASTQRITEATRQPDEPTACNVDRSVWFTYTPKRDMTIAVNTLGSPFDTALGVFTGDALGNLTRVACNDDAPAGGTTSAVSFAATANTTYYVQVGNDDAAANDVGDLSFALQGNDAFSASHALDGAAGMVTGTNVLATKEAGEPAHGALPDGEGGASVWYSWTPPARQRVAFETAAASPLIPLLAVYEGESVDSLTMVAQGSASTTSDRRVEFVAIPGHTYHIAVDGTKPLLGDASQGVFNLTWTKTAAPPDAPRSVTAARGNSSAAVSWVAPASDGGSPITGYTVTASPGGATTTVAASATSATVGTLTNGTAYTFTVRATNDVGDSAESSPSNSVVPATTPGAPTDVTASRGDSSATVSWAAPASNGGSPITGYTVTTSAGGTTSVAGADATALKVTGLTNGSTYTFTVTATNDVGVGGPSLQSAPVVPAALPDPPTGISAARADASGAAIVTWAAPPSGDAFPILSYTVTSKPGGRTATLTGLTADTPLTATVTGLTNGATYTFTVTASNSVGAGGPSAESNQVIPATLPGVPSGVTAQRGDAGAVISWKAPSSDGGSPITSYTIASTTGGHAATLTDVTPDTPLTATINGLTNGTVYAFTVTAANEVGAGQASGHVTGETTAPEPKFGAMGVYSLATEVTATWTVTENGSGLAWYDVRWQRRGLTGAVAKQSDWQRQTAAKLTLTTRPGSTYCFEVTATDNAGNTTSLPVRQCTTTPMDDRLLTASRDWTPGKATGYYRNTYRTTKAQGAKLTSPSFKAKRVSLVATKCRGCGSVKVVAGGVTKTISLHATTTKKRAVILVGTFPVKTTKASITVTSSRKPVHIDGLAFSTR